MRRQLELFHIETTLLAATKWVFSSAIGSLPTMISESNCGCLVVAILLEEEHAEQAQLAPAAPLL